MLQDILMYLAVGVAGGIVNSAAGGAKLFVFPLLLATGLSPLAANATGTVALWPATLPPAWQYRRELVADWKRLVFILVPSLVGALAGALVLVNSPEKAFLTAVPFLLIVAVTAILLGKRLAVIVQKLLPQRSITLIAAVLMLAVGFYGGYFGAGMGFMLLAVLAATFGGQLHQANARKNLFAVCINTVAVVPLLMSGYVDLLAAPLVLIGGLVGGYAGGHVIRRVPDWLLRLVVAGLGLVLTAVFLLR
ncbi:sulfite exporter TauE/SafE family protein [Amorphus coralli]|uniref:sulfite exporter TauE/SafE family protein n=1 Tax=Amorphus coralli TaxID=340680 RepID=UPI000477AE74|nr:sulfite exporter TauE/SafE family protein [Amorphus coralli]